MTFLVFAAAFLSWAWACPPSLAAYRDAGEMVAGAFTLGVLHPTSYPLYSLLGKAVTLVPLGEPAHRLALFSSLCAALAVAGLFALVRRRWGLPAALGAAALLFFNPTLWSVAVVQEMYALWVLGAVALLSCALWVRDRPTTRRACAFAFLFGLCLANRLDVLLWAPGLLWLAFSGQAPRKPAVWAGLAILAAPGAMLLLRSNLPMAALLLVTAFWLGIAKPKAAAFGLLGFSAYLFLPVRSATGPWLDWNHPAALSNLLDSLLRTRYGGTLDLISTNYARGQNFLPNMAVYGRHLWDAFSLPGLLAAGLGAWAAVKKAPQRALGLAAAWLFSGPIFLLLANMPPNPHALAVVEPHYLLSDAALVLFAAEGLALVPPAACALVLVAPLLSGVVQEEARRHHYEAPDFARDALLAVPPGGALVAKKDVQLYSLWHAQKVRGKRADVRLLAQGLSGARWYGGPSLKTEEGWRLLGEPYASPDAENVPAFAKPGFHAGPLAARRQDYDFDEAPDFFSGDLLASRALALLRSGEPAAAWALSYVFPEAAAHLAYAAFQKKDFAEAGRLYGLSAAAAETMIGLSEDYRSLPAAKAAVRKQAAELLTQRGVALERQGRTQDADAAYLRALALSELAQTHFNRAVLYWGKDWGLVERELEGAARLGHAEAYGYLTRARRARTGG